MKDPAAFAQTWVDLWNARNVDGVVAHYREDCRFDSPKAAALLGQGTVHGREALRQYWQNALARVGSLKFALDRALWDPTARALTVLYQADLGGNRTQACEIMTFDDTDRITRGQAFYGAPLPG